MINCLTCGRLFEPANRLHKYCKPTCTPSYIKAQMAKAAGVLRRATMVEVQCAGCGEFFKPKNLNNIYCCSMCRPTLVWSYAPGEPTPFGYVHPKVWAVFRTRHILRPRIQNAVSA